MNFKGMEFTETKILNKRQKRDIIFLWNQEYPKKLQLPTLIDFESYLQGLGDKNHIILTDETNSVRGWLMYFIRDGERWFAMLIDASQQGKGLGSKFLNLAKRRNKELNGWVIDNDKETKENGHNYKSPIGFYQKNGFEILDEIKLEKKEIKGIKVRWKKDGTIER